MGPSPLRKQNSSRILPAECQNRFLMFKRIQLLGFACMSSVKFPGPIYRTSCLLVMMCQRFWLKAGVEGDLVSGTGWSEAASKPSPGSIASG